LQFLATACPQADSLILDGEVLALDTSTGLFLPFGSLGVHKRKEHPNAVLCYVVFDLLYYNGTSMVHLPLEERRKQMEQHIKPVGHNIKLSELKHALCEDDVEMIMYRCMKEGLEGVMLKDPKGTYEPGKRHWLKMKKDYLDDGAMADSADLVCLGAYYGTGRMGGIMSVFLMGCYDATSKQWKTVCKCGNGFDDSNIARLNSSLNFVRTHKEAKNIPSWLDCSKDLYPDFVAKDPLACPVWEIVGAQFSKSSKHTADGISIRFPRVTRERSDKGPEEATDLKHLHALFASSLLSNGGAAPVRFGVVSRHSCYFLSPPPS
jgi:DNA ligase-3